MLQTSFSLLLTGTAAQQQLTVTDTTPASSYGGVNPVSTDLTRLLLIAPLLPSGRFQGPALLPVPSPAGSNGSPFPDAGVTAMLDLPGDELYMVRLLTVWKAAALPVLAPLGTLSATTLGDVYALGIGPVSLDELLTDVQGVGQYVSQSEALGFVLATRQTEARLGTWLLHLAGQQARFRADVDPYLDAALLLEAAREAARQARYPQAAALYLRVRQLVQRKPLTFQQPYCPC